MTHVLDNPIYSALTSGNKHFAVGDDTAFYFQQDVAPFAGMKDNSADEFAALINNMPDESVFVIFSRNEVAIPEGLKVLRHFKMFQMVYEGDTPAAQMNSLLSDLANEHIDEMLTLTKLTNPGPFLQRTIEFSNYTGVISDGKLVAMAGHRMQPLPYVEISAVCTHPEHTGRGYAAKLLTEQIKRIIGAGKIPFLHVLQENAGAVSVYERIGFKTRVPMLGYVLGK
ncbi:GNAT family N-acetyltransferase [Mucilaginibacter conchicola]|uniref:GNAT family N-acetyltransferase n=1 Tax=Mucilaginibacter conchicola TaxID=2303333 RepID=A0A372NY55_9SPHI|nr:GNAT family N-acetyltransferase [Mucilaginibacter conchicola]RFZ94599.1 GNAT family N-acetyltransferase [Mucilaginibacter conchicola]